MLSVNFEMLQLPLASVAHINNSRSSLYALSLAFFSIFLIHKCERKDNDKAVVKHSDEQAVDVPLQNFLLILIGNMYCFDFRP